VCSFFDLGSKVSGESNAFSSRGIKTIHEFKADVPLVVSYIQGATQVPHEFGRVSNVDCRDGYAIFTDAMGLTVRLALDSDFLFGKEF
jgi:hypothetical protein